MIYVQFEMGGNQAMKKYQGYRHVCVSRKSNNYLLLAGWDEEPVPTNAGENNQQKKQIITLYVLASPSSSCMGRKIPGEIPSQYLLVTYRLILRGVSNHEIFGNQSSGKSHE